MFEDGCPNANDNVLKKQIFAPVELISNKFENNSTSTITRRHAGPKIQKHGVPFCTFSDPSEPFELTHR